MEGKDDDGEGIDDALRSGLEDLEYEFSTDLRGGRLDDWDGEGYVRRVLGLELRKMAALYARPEPGGTLVLTAGMSLTPLLLAVAWRRPKVVHLVGSNTDEGREATEAVRRVLVGLEPAFVEVTGLRVELPEPLFVDPSDPARAYGPLVALLRKLASPVVDVTGGKKTMVSAAFVAASEVRATIQYVDFERYSAEARMPFPGSAFVRELTDPAAVLRVREQRAAERAFDAEDFDEAWRRLAELDEAVAQAHEAGYLSETEAELHRQRREYARAAAAWAALRYDEAAALFEAAGLGAPTAVSILGQRWRHRDWRPEARRSLLSKDAAALGAYLADELGRQERALERLEAGDPGADARFSFLRLYACAELALGAVFWARQGELKSGGAPVFDKKVTPPNVARRLSMRGMAILAARGKVELGWKDKETINLCDPPSSPERPPPPSLTIVVAARLVEDGWDTLRNDAVHGFAPVPVATAREVAGCVREVVSEVMRVLESELPPSEAPWRWASFEVSP